MFLIQSLKVRFALCGKSLSDLILDELKVMVTLPSMEELQQRLRQTKIFNMTTSSANIIRMDRDSVDST